MLGAIIGDTIGSRFEWRNNKTKDFSLYSPRCHPTDDSVMTMAVAEALLKAKPDWSDLGQQTVHAMQDWGNRYPNAGYGGTFVDWLQMLNPRPYNSWGNGAGMRVSPCAHAARDLEEAKLLSRLVTEVTHNHPEGIKGAEAVTVGTFLALHGASRGEIRKAMEGYYDISFTLDDIRPDYSFDVSCMGSIPQAIVAFLESTDFEDCLRCALSIGGDADTIACMACAIGGAFYGVPEEIAGEVSIRYLRTDQRAIIKAFEERFPAKR